MLFADVESVRKMIAKYNRTIETLSVPEVSEAETKTFRPQSNAKKLLPNNLGACSSYQSICSVLPPQLYVRLCVCALFRIVRCSHKSPDELLT